MTAVNVRGLMSIIRQRAEDSAVRDRRYRCTLRNSWLQVAISTLSVAISELFQKRGAVATIHLSEQWGWTGLTTLASPLVWFGMAFTILSFITWLYAIRHLPLSVGFPGFPGGARARSAQQLVDSRGNHPSAALVRDRARPRWPRAGGEAGRKIGRKIVNASLLFLILVSLIAFVAGQLLLKRAMESTVRGGYRQRTFAFFIIAGTAAMAVSYFLNLGLLQRLDLSYLYPFQGLSVIFISAAAAVLLREKLTPRLIAGSLLITAGVVLVSLS